MKFIKNLYKLHIERQKMAKIYKLQHKNRNRDDNVINFNRKNINFSRKNINFNTKIKFTSLK